MKLSRAEICAIPNAILIEQEGVMGRVYIKKAKDGGPGKFYWYANGSQRVSLRIPVGTTREEKKFNKEIAYKKARQLEVYGFDVPGVVIQTRTYNQALDEFLNERAVAVKESTYRADGRRLKELAKTFGGRDLSKIDHHAWKKWATKKRRSCSGAAVNRYASILQQFLEWAADCGYRQELGKGLSRYKETPEIRPAETAETAWTVYQDINPRSRLAWLVAEQTGLRRAAIAAITWGMIDFEESLLNLPARIMKSGRTVAIPISEFLRDELAKARDSEPQAGADTRVVKVHKDTLTHDAAKVGGSFHGLRRKFVTDMLRAGVSPGQIMLLGDWSNVAMMMKYARLETDDLRGAVQHRVLGPGAEIVPFKKQEG